MHKRPANISDYPPVLVYFSEPEIAFLFAELVEAQGIQAEIIEEPDCISHGTKIITEPLLFESLPDWAQRSAMVVADGIQPHKKAAVTLLRPLNEENIESAFAKFL